MKKRILCYGDSNTYGFNPRNGLRYPKNIRWPGVLSRVLGSDYEIIEEGCNGRTCVFRDPEEPWKTGADGLLAILNSHKPLDLVILMLGTNDLKAVFPSEPAMIAAGMEILVQQIISFTAQKQSDAAAILLVSPPEIGAGIYSNSPFSLKDGGSFDETAIERSRQLKNYYRNLAERYQLLYVDAAELVKSSEVDSLHLDPEAHEILGSSFAEVIEGYFQKEQNNGSEGSCLNSDQQKNDAGKELDRLRLIAERLRDPETGCPWDRVQTLESMKPYCVEESAEVLAGIDQYMDTGNADNLKEELGDLLLQIVLQSRIAEEEGLFNLSDVVRGISEKMIRRHPHVFHPGDPENGELEDMILANQVRDEEGRILTSWSEIKAREKQGKADADPYLKDAFDQVSGLIQKAKDRKNM